jgi:E3 ubiquitin-protein ligase HUWE1
MLKPAQRVNNPKAVQSAFLAHQDKVTELARGGSIADLISMNTATTENKFTMSFYRTGEGKEEGLQAINITTTPNQYSDRELFWSLVDEHQIPKEYHFELLNRIRIANHMTEVPVKRQLLIIRFISVVIMGKIILINDPLDETNLFSYLDSSYYVRNNCTK